MAITNAQQYQQLVNKPADGKRPGYRGDAAYRSFSAQSTGSQRGSATKNELGGGKPSGSSLRDDPNVKDSRDDEVFQKRQELKKEALRQEEEKREELIERFRNKQFTGLPFPGATSLLNPLFQKGMRVNRNFFLDKVLGAGKFNYMGETLTPEEFAKLSLSDQEDAYKDYMSSRLSGETDAYGNPIMRQDDGGPDPIIPMMAQEEDEETPEEVAKQTLTSRILGSQFDPTFFAADGGIMNADIVGGMMDGNMDEMGRQMYGLGKLVKKATRAVKKIVKSPVGKAAILGGMAYFGGGGGLPKFLKGKGLGGFSFETLFSKKNPLLFTKGELSFPKTMGLSAVLPLLAGQSDEEKDEFLKDYYAQKLEPGTTKRQMGSEFDFYNYNLAEGGMPSKEPVAKKTMPLLDMGGKEKDYRETGGFVDMGRMERADDVPARLSKNEFVFTADAVRNAGDGDIDKGAEVMYNMMKNLESGGDVSEESQGLEGARNMFQTSQRLGEVL